MAGLIVVTWVCGCSAPPLTANPSRFLPPVRLCFKVPLERSCSSCRDISQQGPQASLVGELVRGNNMACSILGRPCKCPWGVISSGDSYLDSNMAVLSPYISLHSTMPSLTILRSGIASSAPVRSDLIDIQLILSGLPSGSASQRSSHAGWSTCLFLFTSFSTSYTGIPSTMCLTTIYRASPHRFFKFCR